MPDFTDLYDQLELPQCHCLNQSSEHTIRHCLDPGAGFLESDAETVGLFASLIAELRHQRHYEWEMVTLLQRTARWKLRARKIGLKKSSVHPS